jgi:nitrous oxidase accessory protein NosD
MSTGVLLGMTGVLTVLAVAVAQPLTVYAGPQGSDTTGTGTAAAPYAMVTAAVGQVASGGTVIVESGTYHESVILNQPVTLEADPALSGTITSFERRQKFFPSPQSRRSA